MYMRATAASGSPSCSRYTREFRITNSKNSNRSTAALTKSLKPSRLSKTYGSRSRRSTVTGISGTKISSSSSHALRVRDVGVRVVQPAHRHVVDGLLQGIHSVTLRCPLVRVRVLGTPSATGSSPRRFAVWHDGVPTFVRILFVALVAMVIGLAVHGLVGLGGSGIHTLLDEWLSCVAEGFAAVLCAVAAFRSERNRAAWLLVAVGMALWTVGDVIWAIRGDPEASARRCRTCSGWRGTR